jgi:hypothetical protein
MDEFQWHRERFDLPPSSARDVQVTVPSAADVFVIGTGIGAVGPLLLDVKSKSASVGNGESDQGDNVIRVFTPKLLTVAPGQLTASFRNDGRGTLALSVAIGIRPHTGRTP